MKVKDLCTLNFISRWVGQTHDIMVSWNAVDYLVRFDYASSVLRICCLLTLFILHHPRVFSSLILSHDSAQAMVHTAADRAIARAGPRPVHWYVGSFQVSAFVK